MCLFLYLGSIFPTYRPSDTVFKITFWLGYFNSCINPIIYPCSSQEFKKAFLSVLGARCLRKRSTPSHALYQSHSPRHGQSQILGLTSRDNPSRLSPSSSIALSRSPSSRDGREWQAPSRTSSAGTTGVSAGVSVGAKVAGMCGKNLLMTCCCVRMDSPQPERPRTTRFPSSKSISSRCVRTGTRCEWARWGNHCTHAGCDASLDRASDWRTQTDEEKRALKRSAMGTWRAAVTLLMLNKGTVQLCMKTLYLLTLVSFQTCGMTVSELKCKYDFAASTEGSALTLTM